MARNYPWYDTVAGTENLRQGDFIGQCPIVEAPQKFSLEETHDIKIKEYDVIILSQSCDLEHKKVDLVLMCPYWGLKEFENTSLNRDWLKQGHYSSYHLLNKCDLKGFKSDFLVVDFKNVFGVNFDFLVNFAKNKKRLRLLPPYREHLSQAFARFFMRVGLPIDIPKLE